MNEDKETKLLEEIQVLENEENINYELVENKRKELYTVRQIKMEGVKIRSKIRWLNDGEKGTKYFCNMENRNYISKCIHSLRKKKNGNLIIEQNEILNETMLYYKRLYSKRSTIDIDLNDFFIEYGIPKLSDIKKMTLEGPIKYEDILIALK